jgi:antitoxin MazE
MMKTKLVSIGNSRGVRLPKPLILQAGLTEDVDLRVRDGAIIISRTNSPRAGWSDAAKTMRRRGEDTLVDPITPTCFDEQEWQW